MISKKTVTNACDTIEQWCGEYKVPVWDVVELLDRLSQIDGNKSFYDSMNAVYKQLQSQKRRRS